MHSRILASMAWRASCAQMIRMKTTILTAIGLAFALLVVPAPVAQAMEVDTNPLCVPPGTLNGACVGVVDGDPCAWYWFGPSHSRICLRDGPSVETCTNHLWGEGWTCELPVAIAVTQIQACVPPGTLNQVCAGTVDGSVCVWFSGASQLDRICVPGEMSATMQAIDLDPLCVPPGGFNGVCTGFVDGNRCAWYWLGANFSRVCVIGADAEVCSNHVWGAGQGYRCQRLGDNYSIGPTICTPDVGTGACVVLDSTSGTCAVAYFGLQGAGACADTDPVSVKVCTSLNTALYGRCPTDIGHVVGPILA